MEPDIQITTRHFLSGAGEMAYLTRSKDWSKTPVGSIDQWPQSLLITLNILLNSKFPMFLWWGPELTCFYNDAYRPSLGQHGKHPSILGMPAAEAWVEIWDIIKPLIDQVLSGAEATWSEDQLIPIYRNGKIEDVYWTFSYSPVRGETGKVEGILVTCFETTEKINILQEQKKSEQRFQAAVDAVKGIVWTNNAKGEMEGEQPGWAALTGQRYEEYQGYGWSKAIHPDDAELTINAWNKSVHALSIFIFEHRVKMTDGKYKEFAVRAIPILNEDGTLREWVGVHTDISETRLAAITLQENQEKLNIVIEASELAMWELNVKTSEIYYSDRYLEILGHKKGTRLTHPQILKQLHPDDLHIREEAFKDAFANGILHYESRLIWNDGSIHWIEGRGKVFFDEDGSPLNMIGTTRDITDEKDYRKQLEEREQKFRLLADSMPQHIWTSDIEGNLNYFNKSVFDYSGLTAKQINKDGWLQIVHPDDREKNIKAWQEAIASGKDFILEHRFLKHDGTYRWQLSRAIPQKDKDGKIRMWVGTSTDIEDQKTFASKLEKQVLERTAELEEKNNELEKMNEELHSFAYVSSHDLQEPLRKIQTFATWLMEKETNNLSETGKDYFRRMQNASNRMQVLIEDLLMYSRTNTAERNFEMTDLDDILEQVKNELKEEIENKQALIESGKLPAIKIIPFQFRQLLLNLVGNAIKFSRPETPPHIIIRSEIIEGHTLNMSSIAALKKYYHLSVSDNGIGFDPIHKDRIFEVFQRLHGKDQYKGTGIGLAIVKKIVLNHNGIITATGEVNKAARFDIYLPIME